MRFSPLSFVIGLCSAVAVPVILRAFRPLAVEVGAVGIGLFEDARRIAAEQMEALEDIAAEARARHDELVATAEQEAEAVEHDESATESEPPSEVTAPRRRGDRSRTRAS